MKRSIILKILIVMVTVIVCSFNIVCAADAFDPKEFENEQIKAVHVINGVPQEEKIDSKVDLNNLKIIFSSVFHIISVVGSIISVIVLVILGIKYMVGSVEERAEYKNTLMPYFIGAICVFGAVNIANIIYKAVE